MIKRFIYETTIGYIHPILLLVPCHRVISSKGKSIGFGAGIDVHEKLLDLEKGNK